MIKDFETVKKQLEELSAVINGFKSEAVQLRIIELLFKGLTVVDEKSNEDNKGNASHEDGTLQRKPKSRKFKKAENNESPKKSSSRGGKLGPISALNQLVSENFFKTNKTIGDIVEYCKNDLATPIKSNDISGKLAELVRKKTLKRIRNTETNQYEYSNA